MTERSVIKFGYAHYTQISLHLFLAIEVDYFCDACIICLHGKVKTENLFRQPDKLADKARPRGKYALAHDRYRRNKRLEKAPYGPLLLLSEGPEIQAASGHVEKQLRQNEIPA